MSGMSSLFNGRLGDLSTLGRTALGYERECMAAKQALSGQSAVESCHCTGPQRGEPVCPCQMRSVTIEYGRFVKRTDLGPVPVGFGGPAL